MTLDLETPVTRKFHDDQTWDVHWVTSPDRCAKIGKRIGKRIVDIKGPDAGDLPYQCIFKGPQTTNFGGNDDASE